MKDYLKQVLIGNILFNPEAIRSVLKKTSYFMDYDPETEKIEFFMNDGGGGQTLFEIRNAPYESARKLALGLGLRGDDGLSWSKYNPHLYFYDDGSEDAQKLKKEIVKSEIPFNVSSRDRYGFGYGQGDYLSPLWPLDVLIKEVRDYATRYADALNTTP